MSRRTGGDPERRDYGRRFYRKRWARKRRRQNEDAALIRLIEERYPGGLPEPGEGTPVDDVIRELGLDPEDL